jgi:adenine phosphoribosyltransferase
MQDPKTYEVKIGYVVRHLPVIKIGSLELAILDILGDTQLVESAATSLHYKLKDLQWDYIVTPAVKSIPLAYELARRTRTEYIVLRKERKSYNPESISTLVRSITSGDQQLFMSQSDANKVMNKDVLLLDDVVSTGETMEAMYRVVNVFGGNVVGRAAIATEGNIEHDVISLVHLPIWRKANGTLQSYVEEDE